MNNLAFQKVSKFHHMDFFGVPPKCHGLIINCGAISERDLHFYNIVVPGEVKCWKCKEGHCPSSAFNEDGFRDEMLGVIKTAWPLRPWHKHENTTIVWTDKYASPTGLYRSWIWLSEVTRYFTSKIYRSFICCWAYSPLGIGKLENCFNIKDASSYKDMQSIGHI